MIRTSLTFRNRVAFICMVALACTAPLLPGCGGRGEHMALSSVAQTRHAAATVTIAWPKPGTRVHTRLIPAAANVIVVTFAHSQGYTASQSASRPASGHADDAVTLTFDNLPAGEYTVTATAYPDAASAPNQGGSGGGAVGTVGSGSSSPPAGAAPTPQPTAASGAAQAVGIVKLTLTADSTTPVALVMNSSIDNIIGQARSGGVGVGRTTTITAQAIATGISAYSTRYPGPAPSGVVVLTSAATWQWTSDNPGVATVTSVGSQASVTGLTPGTVMITATETESGKTASFTLAVVAEAPRYSLEDTGLSADSYYAQILSDTGTLALIQTDSNSGSTAYTKPVLRESDGTLTPLPLPDGATRAGFVGLNAGGQALGNVFVTDANYQMFYTPVLWQGGQVQILAPASVTVTQALSLNNKGEILFEGKSASDFTTAILLTAGGVTVFPADPNPQYYTFASRLADDGYIVGTGGNADLGNYFNTFVRAPDGTVTYLTGKTQTWGIGNPQVDPVDINASHDVLLSLTEAYSGDPYYPYVPRTGMELQNALTGQAYALPPLPAQTMSGYFPDVSPIALTDSGLVAANTSTGYGIFTPYQDIPLIYVRDTGGAYHPFDLNDVLDTSGAGWTLTRVTSANNQDTLAAVGTKDAQSRIVLLRRLP